MASTFAISGLCASAPAPELQNGFTPDIRAAIHSGLKTTFTYAVDLRLDVPGWVDRTIATAVVTTSVDYDNLQRKYSIERGTDGRIDETLVTDDEDVVRQWLTSMKRLQLFPTSLLQENREYYVRVSASARLAILMACTAGLGACMTSVLTIRAPRPGRRRTDYDPLLLSPWRRMISRNTWSPMPMPPLLTILPAYSLTSIER